MNIYLSSQQLRRAADLKDRIEALEAELSSLLGGSQPTPNRRRGMSAAPTSQLLEAPNGVFYGTTFAGGTLGVGLVFELFPPQTPDMMSVTFTSTAAQVGFAGAPGYQYSVLRSADLGAWTVVTNIVMPAAGFYTNADFNPFPASGYYRAAWVP